MNVGIPREKFVDERRVALSPAAVRSLIEEGATVYIEQDAGLEAGWNNADYEEAGATVVFSADETFGRADLLVKVLPPDVEESGTMREEQVLFSYLQLPLARREVVDNFISHEITAIGLENIWYEGGGHPVRRAMSEIAGALAVHAGTEYLSANKGGRGILIGGLPGVPPASVGIIGAGVVGSAAAEAALNMGAHVILVDQKVAPLRAAHQHFGKSLQTAIINEQNIDKLCSFVDVLIGAVLIEDYPTPHLLSREHIRQMKPHSVLVDVGIDQGGIAETSRPTTITHPVYEEEEVIHYCVPNMPAMVPRTSTRAFQNQVLPMLRRIIRHGVEAALREHPYLHTGLNMYKGVATRQSVGETFGIEWKKAAEVLR